MGRASGTSRRDPRGVNEKNCLNWIMTDLSRGVSAVSTTPHLSTLYLPPDLKVSRHLSLSLSPPSLASKGCCRRQRRRSCCRPPSSGQLLAQSLTAKKQCWCSWALPPLRHHQPCRLTLVASAQSSLASSARGFRGAHTVAGGKCPSSLVSAQPPRCECGRLVGLHTSRLCVAGSERNDHPSPVPAADAILASLHHICGTLAKLELPYLVMDHGIDLYFVWVHRLRPASSSLTRKTMRHKVKHYGGTRSSAASILFCSQEHSVTAGPCSSCMYKVGHAHITSQHVWAHGSESTMCTYGVLGK